MPRPLKCRRVCGCPGSYYFKPRAVPLDVLEEVCLAMDEFEAVRLADLEGLYQEQAADKMGVSRQTFGNILESAHRKIAQALVEGKALKISGGIVEMIQKKFSCSECQHQWSLPYGVDRPAHCPQCKSSQIHRAAQDRGRTRDFGRGRKQCGRQSL